MSYVIKEIFDTIQGEGARAGSRAVFVRFAGCNLWNGRAEDREAGAGACAKWCDTAFFGGLKYTTEGLLAVMDALWPRATARRWCVLTGGEPALQVDQALVDALNAADWWCAIETNGTKQLPLGIAHVCVSPKIGGDVLGGMYRAASEVKVVLPGTTAPEEGWTAEQLNAIESEAPAGTALYVQPQDPVVANHAERGLLYRGSQEPEVPTYDRASIAQCVAWVRGNPRWRLSTQQHKILGVR